LKEEVDEPDLPPEAWKSICATAWCPFKDLLHIFLNDGDGKISFFL
jgi:hypothetical protein